MYIKSIIILLLTLVYSLTIHAQANKTLKVLFIGNSYTYVNNLPQLIKDIALANGDTLIFDSNCPGGYTFNNHFNNATSISKINAQPWDVVILQAQSQEPAFPPAQVASQTLPYAIKLDSVVHSNNSCVRTVFYETWGRKNGDPQNCPYYTPLCTYTGMQNRLRQSYKLFADTCKSEIAPAGEAWRKSINLNPSLELYSSDQSHPSIEGSYLAACVFYEVLFSKSVIGNVYTASVPTATASALQQIAHDVVNDSLSTWNIGKYTPCVTTGIVKHTSLPNVVLYPNPASNVLHTEIHSTFNIYDIFGNLCLSGNNSEAINIESLKQGLYFIEFLKVDTTKKLKFIKQ